MALSKARQDKYKEAREKLGSTTSPASAKPNTTISRPSEDTSGKKLSSERRAKYEEARNRIYMVDAANNALRSGYENRLEDARSAAVGRIVPGMMDVRNGGILPRETAKTQPVTIYAQAVSDEERMNSLRQRAASATEATDDEDEILRMAREDPAGLREKIAERVSMSSEAEDLYRKLYPNSGVIDTAKGMGEGLKIGVTKQFPASMAGLATGAHESVGTFWNMINTPVKDGKVEYEDYISPLRDDALRLKEAADAASLANLEGRGPASARLVGVSQSAGNMIPGAAVGGIGGALTGGALSGLSTALISAGAGGSSYLEAIQQGAGVGEAAAYGILSGATEYVTERLFGGNPLVDTRPGLVNQVVKKLGGSQKLLSFLASQPVETLNEGLEEAISEILNPVWQRLTYDPNADFATLEQIMDSAIDGVLLAGFMQGGSAVMERALRGKSKNTNPTEHQNAIRADATAGANVYSGESASSPVQSTDARAYLNGDGPVTNSQAERIMDDASVMQELGIDTNGKTRAQIRRDVKAKVSEMRAQNTQSLTEQVAQKETDLRNNVLESAKRTMGERGYATFEQAMRDDIDPAVYYRELTRAYNEGLASADRTGSNVVTKVQYDEMYKAGQDDAMASLSAQVKNAGNATSFKNGGIDYMDADTKAYVSGALNKETTKALDTVSKALGIKVRFADSVAGGDANAQYANGIVTIEKNNPNPVRFLFSHEITHRMQSLAPEEYSRLRSSIASEDGWVDAAIKEVQDLYERNGRSISSEDALDEVVADYVGTLLENNGELERFIEKHRTDRTLLEKLRDIVRDIVRKLKGADKDSDLTQEQKRLKDVEKRLSETLAASVKQAKKNAKAQKNTTQKSGGEVKFSLKYADAIDQLRNGTLNRSENTHLLVAEHTPQVYIDKAGAKDLKIIMGWDIAYLAMNKNGEISGNYHGLGADVMKEIPKALEDPLYIVKQSDGRINAVTEIVVKGKRAALVSIELDTYKLTKQDGESEAENYNLIVTVFDAKPNYLQNTVFKGNVVHNKNNEAPAHFILRLKSSEKTVPDNAPAGASGATVSQNRDSVKHRSEVHNRVMNNQPVSADDEIKYSLKHDKQYMDLAIMSNDRRGFVSKRVMNEAAKARQAVADIFNDPDLADSLGLPPDVIGNTYIPNNSYSGTEENTTVCIRSIAADALMDAVAEHLGRPLTVEDTIAISQEYWKYTDKPECLYCYVAMDRKAHREFLGSYLEQRKAVLDNIHNGMSREEAYQKFLDGRKDTKPMRNRFDLWLKNDGKKLITPSDIASAANMENAIARDPSLKPQINDALKYAQSASWAKKRIGYAAYNNHILKWKQSRINSLNSNYGLRMYSFSDFSPAFILENMQMVTDAAVRGLKVLAYTKELDFVKIFSKSGMNINISVFGYDDGNGGVAMDAMQGADWAEAQALRNQYSNVGCTFVATNDAQVNWALDQDWIDVIIPFHMVRTGTKVANHFGWKNYTAMSADTKNKAFDKTKNAPHILPPVHQNDKATYLKACEDNNLTPRFNDWVDHPNYMKLVNETRQSEVDTKPVQPIFDVDAAKKSIDDMRKRGGYYTPIGGSEENMRYIAGEIAESISGGAKMSLKDSDSLAREIARIQKDGAKNKRSDAEIQADVRAVVQEAYQNMVSEYGAIRTGEKPAREVQVPKRTTPNNRVSQTVRTVMEAGATPDEALPTIEEMTARGDFSYEVYGDEQAIQDARDYIGKDGWDEAQRKWFNDVRSGNVSKRNTTIGWLLYDNAVNNGNTALAMDVLSAMVEHQRSAAQAVQATRILKQLSPETQLYGVQRSIDSLQRELDEKGRSRKKNAKAAGATAEAATDARREAVTEMAKVYKNGKVSRRGNRVVVEGNAAGEPFVFEYAQKVGEDIAKSLKAKLNSTKKERTFLQHISAQLKRFANEKLPPAEKGKSITAVEMLRDYIQNQAFYNEAWEAAQQELRDKYADDAMLSEFINSGIGVDANLTPRNAIFMRALVKSAAESRETKANIIRQSALGVTQISENIAAQLIKETGAEGEMAQTIRDAAAGYVHDVLVEAETNAEKPLEADKLITSAIKGAMKDIGITLSDVVTSGTGASAKQAIINKLITKYAFGFAEATNTAEIVERQFDAMSRKLAESKLQSMFKKREHSRRTISEQMKLLGNLGAFDIGSAYNSAAAERIFKQGVTLHINEGLAAQFLQAKTQEARDEILKEIYRDIGRQMPSTFTDKWNAWRYMAMLGNVRTHVRNVAGNAFFAPVVAAKDLTATAIERAVYRVSGGKTQRTKGKVNKALLSAAWADYSKVADTVAGGGKYSDLANANKYIEEGRRIFKLKPLEAARRGNSAALEAEDAWFSKPHYAFAMAQYCQANGITEAQIRSGKGIEEARAYAAKEAQKATYRDTNMFSEWVSSLGRNRSGNAVQKGISMVTEGIIPFRKTPANILVRGLEYSPIGLLNGIKQAVWDVRRGDMSSAEAIDSISAGLTGTGLMGLGIFLAAQGLIRGHGGDDDDKREFEEMMGHQSYSLEFGNTSVTLDWLAPEALPFFIGVNLWETTQGEDKDVTLASMLSAASTVTEPLLDMSCLQSLNNAFEAVGYATSNDMSGLETVLSAAATSYLTQALPTLLGQAERSTEGTRMTTYTEKNGFLTSDMQYTLGRASSRLPGWDYQQIPYIDAWGRTEDSGGAVERTLNNFLNPAYMSDIDTSETEAALLALYEQTGDASILPSRARKYFTVDGERKDLTAEEYVVYAQEKGQRSYQLVSDLMNSIQFNSMSDDEKVNAIRDAYDLANQQAKAAISDYGVDKWVDKAEEAQKKYGISEETYVGLKSRTASLEGIKDKDGETIPNSKSLKIMQEVYNTPGLSEKQRKALFEYLGVGKKVQHYNKFKVQEELSKMERQAK